SLSQASRCYATSTSSPLRVVPLPGSAPLPLPGPRRSLVLASAISMAIAVLPLTLQPLRSRHRAIAGLCIVLLALGLPWLLPGWDPDLMSGGGFLYGPVYRSASGGQAHVRDLMHRRGEILFSREDGVGLVTVRRSPAGIHS